MLTNPLFLFIKLLKIKINSIMEYVVNGETVDSLDFTEYVTPFKVTEEFIEGFNNTNTKCGITKNIINDEYIDKWAFLVYFEKDGCKQEICSSPYKNRDVAFDCLNSFIESITYFNNLTINENNNFVINCFII